MFWSEWGKGRRAKRAAAKEAVEARREAALRELNALPAKLREWRARYAAARTGPFTEAVASKLKADLKELEAEADALAAEMGVGS